MIKSTINYPTRHTSSRQGAATRWIVVHTTEGNSTLPNAAAYLASNALGVSAHELAGEGIAYLMAPDHLATHHAGAATARLPSGETGQGVNRASWGIEIHNRAGQPPSAGAYLVAVARIAEACKRLRLPVEKIIAHRDVDPSRRSDPTGVNMDTLRADVLALMAPKPPPVEIPKWSQEARNEAAYYAEALLRLAEGQEMALDELATLLHNPRAAEIRDVLDAVAVKALHEARDR